MFSFFTKLPQLNNFSLKSYSVCFSLNKLGPGIDNFRFDVHLSPGFCKASSKITAQIISSRAGVEEILNAQDTRSNRIKERDEFKRLYSDLMTRAINKAKAASEVQIDFLAQAAVVKMLLNEIILSYEILIERFKTVIREDEISYNDDDEIIELKKQLTYILQNRDSIIRNTGKELFQYIIDVNNKNLNKMREANFGSESILPDDVFSNSILHTENPADDFFMIEEYDILPGRRLEDPDKYEILITTFRNFIAEIDRKNKQVQPEGVKKQRKESKNSYNKKIEDLIRHKDNIDILFNYFQSERRYNLLKKENKDKKEIIGLKDQAKKQKIILNYFYRKLNKTGLIRRINASYEMRPIYSEYCPPLIPQLVLQFLSSTRGRKLVINRLKRINKISDSSLSIVPLKKIVKKLQYLDSKIKKEYLIRFFKGFIRYHKDMLNFKMIKNAIDSIHLAVEEKKINLSRTNNTLYEFLLPHEELRDEKPVISHVILKADVRGSTDLVHKMKQRGLNPASYFSLNFFDPITEVLSEYGAVKVCIEGDAYILTIYEREDTPEGWYSVARACGLALKMLFVVNRYNVKNKKYKFPILELGIGITFRNIAPTIFFDGDNQIMISSAINLADRLSGCSKPVRRLMADRKKPFNLYVFQTVSDEEIAATADDIFARYNVNGIDLHEPAFKKLCKEINLKPVEYSHPNLQGEKIKLYVGKYPTVTGRYQKLIIRESQIQHVCPEDLSLIKLTSRKYYEVCTNPDLYDSLNGNN
ncbi:Guanylate cyclase domain-containing protein [Candidatus Magnetomoraceae bacterium gMMP-15]